MWWRGDVAGNIMILFETCIETTQSYEIKFTLRKMQPSKCRGKKSEAETHLHSARIEVKVRENTERQQVTFW